MCLRVRKRIEVVELLWRRSGHASTYSKLGDCCKSVQGSYNAEGSNRKKIGVAGPWSRKEEV